MIRHHFCFGCGFLKPSWGFPADPRFVDGIIPWHIGCERNLVDPGGPSGQLWSVLYTPEGRKGRVFAEFGGDTSFRGRWLPEVIASLRDRRATDIEVVRHWHRAIAYDDLITGEAV